LRTTAAPTAHAAAPAAKGAAPTAAQKPTPAAQRSAAPVVPSIKTIDKVLIFSATVTSLAAVGGVVWVFLTLQKIVQDFSS
jgi:hypothetical protein